MKLIEQAILIASRAYKGIIHRRRTSRKGYIDREGCQRFIWGLIMKDLFSKPKNQKHKGQALVEFSLTLLVFLLLIFLIFEVGRIMQVYLTLQHAAKQGARYGVTGDYMATYASDPLAGWDLSRSSDDPLDSIPPCWPRFYDDLVAPTLPSIEFYEPYRDSRTCSIEEVTLRSMAGLRLDPFAGSAEGGYYQVVVRGVGDAVTPSTSITRYITEPTHVMSGIYPADPIINTELTAYGYDYTHSGDLVLYPGFGGKPNQNIVVQVEYRLAITTPILSSIAPSIRLVGQAKMTNESFGSTGTARGAVLPPALPPIPTLGLPIPPDLVITSFGPVNTGTKNPGNDVDFNISISNLGGLDAISGSGYNVRVFAYDPDEGAGQGPLTATEMELVSSGAMAPPGVELIGVTNVFTDSLLAGSSLDTTLTMQLPNTMPGGIYYLYALVDGADVISEDGDPAETNFDPTREDNNLYSPPLTIVVGAEVDLSIQSVVPETLTPDPGNTVYFQVTAFNAGPNASPDTYIKLMADGANILNGFSLNGASTPSCTTGADYFLCDLDQLLNGGTKTATFVLNTIGAVGSQYDIYAFVDFTGSAIEIVANRPNNTSSTYPVYIGAVDLKMDIAVDNDEPSINDVLQYTVRITNDSPNVATNVVVEVSNDLAGNIQFLATPAPSVGAGSLSTLTDNLIIWNIPTLPGNTSYDLVFDAEVISNNGNVRTTAAITSTHVDFVASDDSDSVLIEMQSADLAINKVIMSPTNGMASEFMPITYRITVVNNVTSDVESQAVVVTDTLPDGLVYNPLVPPTTTRGAVTYDAGTRTFTWSGFNLGVGQNAIMNYTVTVAENAHEDYGSALNIAEVTADTADDNLANNIDDNTNINLVLQADLKLEVTLNKPIIQAGQAVVYTFTATNKSTSPSIAENVRVTGILNGATALAAFSSVSVSGAITGTFNPITGTWNIGNLNPGQSVTMTLNVDTRDTMATNPTTVASTFAITSDVTDPNTSDNSVSRSLKIYDFGIFVNNGTADSSCDVITEWGWDLEYGFNWYRDYSSHTINGVTVYRWNEDRDGKEVTSFVAPSGYRAPNQDLMRCYRRGDFGYAFENLPAGQYRIVVLSANSDSRDHSFDAYYQIAGMSGFTRWLDDFDSATQVYAINQSANISVQAGGYIYAYIQAQTNRDGYIRGIGIYMVSDTP